MQENETKKGIRSQTGGKRSAEGKVNKKAGKSGSEK